MICYNFNCKHHNAYSKDIYKRRKNIRRRIRNSVARNDIFISAFFEENQEYNNSCSKSYCKKRKI